MTDEFTIDPPSDLPEGWQLRDDGVSLLAMTIGRALKSHRDEDVLPLARVAAELENAGNDDWARMVIQAILLHLTGRAGNEADALQELMFEAALYVPMLQEVSNTRSPQDRLRIATLTVAGRIAIDEGDFELAASLFESVARAWDQQRNMDELVAALLAQSAALHYAEQFPAAQDVIDRALSIAIARGDRRGQAMLLLNNIQNALSTGDVDGASKQIEDVRPLVNSLRDGHISASLQITEASWLIDNERYREARRLLLAAVKSARRRDDGGQLTVALKNVARLTSEHFSEARGLRWWTQARDVARTHHDWRDEQSIERTMGVALAELERFSESVDCFQRAVDLNEKFGDAQSAARSRADQGASIFTWSRAEMQAGNEASSAELLLRSEATIDQARLDLESLHDFEWAEICVRNLRAVWGAAGRAVEGVAALRRSLFELSEVDENYAAELLRSAALLALGAPTVFDRREAIDWLIEATNTHEESRDQRAWSLASDAGLLKEVYGLSEAAVIVFDAALSFLDPKRDPTAWGNIQNDAAIAATSADDLDGARERFLSVETLARGTENRALLALATKNLAELAARADENDRARALFSEAAMLHEAIGNIEEAADAWASIANSWVDDNDADSALEAQAHAFKLATLSESGDAMARALSARASISYLQGEFESSFDLWNQSADFVEDRDAGEYQAFALDSLARIGDWRKFKRELDRLGSASQRSGTQLEFVEKLYLAGLSWLRMGRPRAAGVVLGYIVLLGLDGTMHSRRTVDGSVGGEAAKNRSLLAVASPLGAAYAFLNVLDLDPKDRAQVRRQYERTVEKFAGTDAQGVLDLVDGYLEDENV